MKKFLVALFLVSTPAYADKAQDYVCAQIGMRYAIFHTFATLSNNKDTYQSTLYAKLLDSPADASTVQMLKSLVDLAWNNRHGDIVESANKVYLACIGTQQT